MAAIPAAIAVAADVPVLLMYCGSDFPRFEAGTSTPSVPKTFPPRLGRDGLKFSCFPSVFVPRIENTVW